MEKMELGKSNLGYALFDITITLTDTSRGVVGEYSNYENLDSNSKEVEFKYEFKFDDDILYYEYRKKDINTMCYEKLIYNDILLLEYDFNNKDKKIVNIEEAKNLNWKYEKENNNISIVKYIINNTILSEDNPLDKLMKFVDGMLWCKNINADIGDKSQLLSDIIFKKNKLKEFEQFLRECGINYNLKMLQDVTGVKIGATFKKGTVDLNSIISTGTRSLWLYYCWRLLLDELKFVYMDEFDANYHFELAIEVVKFLNAQDNLQTIVTTHNVSLMSNKITRPDCVFIISENKINNLSNCTEKELREAHNIEKLYREGSFTQ